MESAGVDIPDIATEKEPELAELKCNMIFCLPLCQSEDSSVES